MKKNTLKNWAIGLPLFLMTAAHAVGHRDGNGGSFVRTQYLIHGNELVSYLSRDREGQALAKHLALDAEKIRACLAEDKILLKSGPLHDVHGSQVDAIFENGVVTLDKDRWDSALFSGTSVAPMVHHELLRCAGYNDDSNRLSSQIRLPESATLKSQVWAPHQGEILAEHAYQPDKNGFVSENDAKAFCEQKKALYSNMYFLVVCEFHEKTWRGLEASGIDYTEQPYVAGYTSEGYSVYSRKGSQSSEYSYLASIPLVLRERVPYTYYTISDRTVWGVRVVGIGRLDLLPWKPFFSSLRPSNGAPAITYGSEESARKACRQVVVEVQTSSTTTEADRLLHHRAQCRTMRASDERYGFEIVTQNPLYYPSLQ